ncbi:MAG TPA: heparin lyase I family protein [Gaiellaceae bacterium]|nr:heparin lyase I family protein [Gaiellaceae bacterium]
MSAARLRAGAVVLVAIAVAVVVFAALHRRGSGVVVALDWQTGDNSSFSNLECPHPDTQFGVVTSPVRQGRYAARFSESARDVWINGTVRCLDANYDSAATTGEEHYFGFSMYIPRGGLSDNLVWELHQPRELYTLRDCGVAPVAIVVSRGAVALRLFTGDCTVGRGFPIERAIVFPNLKTYPREKWIDIVLHIRFEEASTGLVEAWSRTAGSAWPARPQISLVAIPTMPFCSSCGIFNVTLYTEMGLYPGYSGYHEQDTLYVDGSRRGRTFDAVAPPG